MSIEARALRTKGDAYRAIVRIDGLLFYSHLGESLDALDEWLSGLGYAREQPWSHPYSDENEWRAPLVDVDDDGTYPESED